MVGTKCIFLSTLTNDFAFSLSSKLPFIVIMPMLPNTCRYCSAIMAVVNGVYSVKYSEIIGLTSTQLDNVVSVQLKLKLEARILQIKANS